MISVVVKGLSKTWPNTVGCDGGKDDGDDDDDDDGAAVGSNVEVVEERAAFTAIVATAANPSDDVDIAYLSTSRLSMNSTVREIWRE